MLDIFNKIMKVMKFHIPKTNFKGWILMTHSFIRCRSTGKQFSLFCVQFYMEMLRCYSVTYILVSGTFQVTGFTCHVQLMKWCVKIRIDILN